MSLLTQDFESGVFQPSGWSMLSGGDLPTSATGNGSAYAMSLTNSGGYGGALSPTWTAVNSLIAQFDVKMASAGGMYYGHVFELRNGSTKNLSVKINSSMQVELYRYASGTPTLVATSTLTTTASVFHTITIEATLVSLGSAVVKVDGTEFLNVSAVDFADGVDGATRCVLGSFQSIPTVYDNVIVDEVAALTLNDGVVISYRFENPADLGHDDYNYANLTITGTGVTQTTGKTGYALQAVPGSYSISGEAATDIDPADGLTIAFWAKTGNTTGAGNNRLLFRLQGHSVSHTAGELEPAIYLNSSGGTHVPSVIFYDSADTPRTLTLSAVSDPTQWHFYCVRLWAGVQSFSIDDGTPATGSYTLDLVVNAPQQLRKVVLAQTSDSATLDHLVVWNRYLSDAHVTELYDSGAGEDWPYGAVALAQSGGSSAATTNAAVPARAQSGGSSAAASNAAVPARAQSGGSSGATVNGAVPALAQSSGSTGATATVPAPAIAQSSGSAGATINAAVPALAESSGSSGTTAHATVAEPAYAQSGGSTGVAVNAAVPARAQSGGSSGATASGVVPARAQSGGSSATPLPADAVETEFNIESSGSTAASAKAVVPARAESSGSTGRTAVALTRQIITLVPGTAKLFGSTGNGTAQVNEQDTGRITVELTDGTGAFPISAIQSLIVTTYGGPSRTLLRPSEPALNDNGVTLVTDTGKSYLRWDFESFETVICNAALGMNSTEEHFASFEASWQAEDDLTLSDPFSVAADSQSVTVTQAGHGLIAGRDTVVFENCRNVGGLDLDGAYMVTSVIDANRYTVTHKSKLATASAIGGGSVRCLVSPRRKTFSVKLSVKRSDVT